MQLSPTLYSSYFKLPTSTPAQRPPLRFGESVKQTTTLSSQISADDRMLLEEHIDLTEKETNVLELAEPQPSEIFDKLLLAETQKLATDHQLVLIVPAKQDVPFKHLTLSSLQPTWGNLPQRRTDQKSYTITVIEFSREKKALLITPTWSTSDKAKPVGTLVSVG